LRVGVRYIRTWISA